MAKTKKNVVTENKDIEEPVQEVVEANPVVEETVEEVSQEEVTVETVPVAEEPKVDTPVTNTVVEDNLNGTDTQLAIGMKVKLKDDCVKTYTGDDIPAWAHRNTYKIKKIIGSRVIINSVWYVIAVSDKDIVLV